MPRKIVLEAKTDGRPVGKPPSRPVGRANDANRVINRLYGSFRKETPMLSGPRRTQARSHLPKIRPDTRCGQSRKRPTTGPCGELATHFMGLLVLMGRSTGILPVRIGLTSVVSGPLSVVSGSGRRVPGNFYPRARR